MNSTTLPHDMAAEDDDDDVTEVKVDDE